jgi:hypothetical protein
MTKHTLLTRTTMIAALFVTLIGMGACTKHTTQIVDQGFSAIYNIEQTDWKTDNSDINVEPTLIASLSVPEINDQIVQQGGVAVYISFDNPNPISYDALPETIGGYIYSAEHTNGTVNIRYWSINGTQPSAPTGRVHVKVVILDATSLD